MKNGDVQTISVADKASLSGLRRSIRADLSRAGVDPSFAFDCLVAVTEACTQLLLRHSGEMADGPAITWEIDSGCVRFQIHERFTRTSCKASHPSGGGRVSFRGRDVVPDDLPLALMNGLMDEVVVRDGSGGRTTTLTKQLQ